MNFPVKRIFSLRNRLILLFLFSATVGLIYFMNINSLNEYSEKFEKKLSQLESEAGVELEKIHSSFITVKNPSEFLQVTKYPENLFREKGIVYLVYMKDSLLFWSDNSPSVENYRKEICLDNSIARLRNGWYEVTEYKGSDQNKLHVIALILLKREYGYQNKYLQSGYPEIFGIPSTLNFSEQIKEEGVVRNKEGKPLFSITNSDRHAALVVVDYVLNVLIYLIYLLAISVLYSLHFRRKYAPSENTRLFLFLLSLLLLRIVMLALNFPSSFLSGPLFDSSLYGNSSSFIFPYLGDFLMNILVLFIFSLVFGRHFTHKKGNGKFLPFLYFIVPACCTLLLNSAITSLVQNSHLSFRLNDFFTLTPISFLAIAGVAFIFISLFQFTIKILKILEGEKRGYMILFLFGSILCHSVISITVFNSDVFSAFWPVVFLVLIFLTYKRKIFFSFFALLPVVTAAVLVTTYLFNLETLQKERDYRRVYAENLAGQQDDVAENLFVDVSKKIRSDESLRKMIYGVQPNPIDLEKRIRQIYLGGYWEKFEVLISITDSACNPLIKTENPLLMNNSFFDDQIESCGISTVCSDFYFVDHPGSRQRYIARIPITDPVRKAAKPSQLYIQFELKAGIEEKGFPELLLDRNVKTHRQLKEYSYAVYKDSTLLYRSGKYIFPPAIYWQQTSKDQFTEFVKDGFHHVVYSDMNVSSVAAVPVDSLSSNVTMVSSFFAFFSLILILYLFSIYFVTERKIIPQALGVRIQFLLLVMVAISLLSFGAGTFYVVRKQFDEQNRSYLQQQSALLMNEMQSKFAEADALKSNYQEYTGYLLKNISSLFQSDLTLFDINGNLFASSQPRLFEEGIVSKKINPVALRELKSTQKSGLVLKEFIGKLEFYSAYKPLYNKHGRLLGYANLPYFAKQDTLEKEISMYISALTNIYVLLFVISLIVALFFSNLVIRPLKMLQKKFSTTTLGGKNEPLEWKENDEIGTLVTEYNNMIKALELSAEKLAKSERESAWKEMAKQVAHEIKNPLTPMRLNIQHLQRTIDGTDAEQLKDRVKKLAAMLIEQIDTLSSIATAFSSFARMPVLNMSKVNVLEISREVVQLFSETQNAGVNLISENLQHAWVQSDKDQLSRVLINLIKNAVQSIPEDRAGIIDLVIGKANGLVKIEVRDNGTGISDEIANKIFQPNFSTKTEGMGLGLAMVKSAVESFGGRIYFETEPGKGTIFFIELDEAATK